MDWHTKKRTKDTNKWVDRNTNKRVDKKARNRTKQWERVKEVFTHKLKGTVDVAQKADRFILVPEAQGLNQVSINIHS